MTEWLTHSLPYTLIIHMHTHGITVLVVGIWSSSVCSFFPLRYSNVENNLWTLDLYNYIIKVISPDINLLFWFFILLLLNYCRVVFLLYFKIRKFDFELVHQFFLIPLSINRLIYVHKLFDTISCKCGSLSPLNGAWCRNFLFTNRKWHKLWLVTSHKKYYSSIWSLLDGPSRAI